MGNINDISMTPQNGKGKIVKVLAGQALVTGRFAHEILQEGLMRGMAVIGKNFKHNEVFVKGTQEENCNIICCFALLITTMGIMANILKAVKAVGLKDKVRGIIGGAPVTQVFCNQIGADTYTLDTASAVDKAAAFCIGG